MPYLEISIYDTIEKEMSIELLTSQLSEAYSRMYSAQTSILGEGDQSKVVVTFKSKEDFNQIYNKSYNLYVYLFDNFLTKYSEFSSLFHFDSQEQPKIQENYMVLRFQTDYIQPLRRYYGFTNRVNQIFGSNVYNEEILGGYLRFIFSKEDYLHLIHPANHRKDWEEIFLLKHVALDNPLVQAFLETFDKWNQIWDTMQKKTQS